MTYIITFFSHFGAIRYKSLCDKAGINSKLMPVPRSLSSSCGTCISCDKSYLTPDEKIKDEIDKIFLFSDNDIDSDYKIIYQ